MYSIYLNGPSIFFKCLLLLSGWSCVPCVLVTSLSGGHLRGGGNKLNKKGTSCTRGTSSKWLHTSIKSNFVLLCISCFITTQQYSKPFSEGTRLWIQFDIVDKLQCPTPLKCCPHKLTIKCHVTMSMSQCHSEADWHLHPISFPAPYFPPTKSSSEDTFATVFHKIASALVKDLSSSSSEWVEAGITLACR